MSDKLKIQQERKESDIWKDYPYKGYPDPINSTEVWSISDTAEDA